MAIQADSTDATDLEGAVRRAVDELGPLGALVVNAGTVGGGPVGTATVKELDRMLTINVRAVFLSIQAAVPQPRSPASSPT